MMLVKSDVRYIEKVEQGIERKLILRDEFKPVITFIVVGCGVEFLSRIDAIIQLNAICFYLLRLQYNS